MKNKILIIGIFLLWGIFTTNALASNAKFSWLPNSETDLAGYKIHYGTADGVYPDSVDIASIIPDSEDGRMHGEVTDLVVGDTYYFVCTAYNTSDEESGFSQMVSFTATEETINIPIIMGISIKEN